MKRTRLVGFGLATALWALGCGGTTTQSRLDAQTTSEDAADADAESPEADDGTIDAEVDDEADSVSDGSLDDVAAPDSTSDADAPRKDAVPSDAPASDDPGNPQDGITGGDGVTDVDGGTDGPTDAAGDGGMTDGGMPDGADAGGDTSSSCLDAGYAVGERYSVGDNCNFCDCLADGTSVCTERTCGNTTPSCTYDGVDYPYAVLFPAADGCNDCVCAASGLACTHRCPELPQEGAILLETLDAHCGEDVTFTGAAVLGGLTAPDVTLPFSYNTSGTLHPETLSDTTVRIRVVYEDGFVVCRLPSPTQPAIDMEVTVEWMTEDGAFDEGLHTYLRRNNFGFLDAWFMAASAPASGLDGSFDPNCPDPGGFGFAANWYADGTLDGSVSKICEVDIYLDVGTYAGAP